jgi:hypothetical protein
MVFSPSPAIHKIRQLVRLIRNNPNPTRESRNIPWRIPELPDPAQFVDSSVMDSSVTNNAIGLDIRPDRTDSGPRRKRSGCPGNFGR